MCSLHASVASSTALPKSFDNDDSSIEIALNRSRASGSRATPDKVKSRIARSTATPIGIGQIGEGGGDAERDEQIVQVAVLTDLHVVFHEALLPGGVGGAQFRRVGNAM